VPGISTVREESRTRRRTAAPNTLNCTAGRRPLSPAALDSPAVPAGMKRDRPAFPADGLRDCLRFKSQFHRESFCRALPDSAQQLPLALGDFRVLFGRSSRQALERRRKSLASLSLRPVPVLSAFRGPQSDRTIRLSLVPFAQWHRPLASDANFLRTHHFRTGQRPVPLAIRAQNSALFCRVLCAGRRKWHLGRNISRKGAEAQSGRCRKPVLLTADG
jgi:hypothetical protein